MGWLALLLIGLLATGALLLAGLGGSLRLLGGAALLLGAAGYALQAKPSLPGSPTVAGTRPIDVDPGFVAFRTAILGNRSDAVLSTADAQTRRGDTGAAAQTLIDAIRGDPDAQALWIGLGNALATNDGGKVSPAAAFAFQQAIRLDPRAPGPWFFLGLAQAQDNNFDAARLLWRRALALTPANAPYRQDIAMRVAMVEGMLARQP